MQPVGIQLFILSLDAAIAAKLQIYSSFIYEANLKKVHEISFSKALINVNSAGMSFNPNMHEKEKV